MEDDQIVRSYLLDELAPDERRRLEERLLDDRDDFFNQLQIAEEELADDYVTGALSESERTRFVEIFLSNPLQFEQVRFAETLRGYFANQEPAKKKAIAEEQVASSWVQKLSTLLGLDRPVVGFTLACGLVLAVAFSAWLGLRTWRLQYSFKRMQTQQQSSPAAEIKNLQEELAQERARRDIAAQEALREQAQRAGLEQELARLKAGNETEAASKQSPAGEIAKETSQTARRAASRILAVTLTSGLVRESGKMKTISITPATKVVRLQLDTGADEYTNYRATLESAEGKSLFGRTALRAREARGGGRVIIFDVPAKLLKGGGDFQVGLIGLTSAGTAEDIPKYYFNVVRN